MPVFNSQTKKVMASPDMAKFTPSFGICNPEDWNIRIYNPQKSTFLFPLHPQKLKRLQLLKEKTKRTTKTTGNGLCPYKRRQP